MIPQCRDNVYCSADDLCADTIRGARRRAARLPGGTPAIREANESFAHSEPNRLAILRLVRDRPQAVGETQNISRSLNSPSHSTCKRSSTQDSSRLALTAADGST
jgi:hypothetical protein